MPTKNLNLADIKPLYFLVGEGDFEKERFVQKLKAALCPRPEESLNYEYLIWGEMRPPAILDAVRTPGWDLFSQTPGSKARKLVVIAEAEKISPDAWKLFEDCFINPSPDACLVFLIRSKPRRWSKPPAVPSGSVKTFSPLTGDRLVAWIKMETAARGLRLSEPAIRELLLRAGDDPFFLSNELDKLVLFKEEGAEITPREVREITGAHREASIFNLSKYIIFHQTGPALQCLRRLLRDGEKPLKILAILLKDIRRLWLGREIWEHTRNMDEAFQAAGVRYYRGEFRQQMKQFDLRFISRHYHRLLEANVAMKGSGGTPELALERLVIELSREFQ